MNKEIFLQVQSFNILKYYMENKIECKLMMWNNDNWDYPLPTEIMENFKVHLNLDIKGELLERSFIKDNKIIINTMFIDKEYSKYLEFGEIFAILDEKGQPIILNQYPQLTKEDKLKIYYSIEDPTNTKELIESIISKTNADPTLVKNSINSFAKNNKNFSVLNK